MIFSSPPPPPDAARAAINTVYLADETACVEALLAQAALDDDLRRRIHARALALIERVRRRPQPDTVRALLREYDLSSHEGVLLMCLAEALLRIPDAATADHLIREKLAQGEWDKHLGHSDSLFVNASTWGLMLTGRLVRLEPANVETITSLLKNIISKSGDGAVRLALKQAMRLLGGQFVMGRTIEEALERARGDAQREYRHSFDMLGEAAHTAADAERYTHAYSAAIRAVAAHVPRDAPNVYAAPGISIKLSALHPRYEYAQRERVLAELAPRLLELARQARAANIGLTLDAEEADRLDLSLDLFAEVFGARELAGWEGFGLAVQAYQKRAIHVIGWLVELSRAHGKRIPVRLVKGAYWDTEIKRAQQAGLADYPVFTRKEATDVSYLACAKKLFGARDILYPQFATHNAHTVAAILELAGNRRAFEFQRLHGMGESLYAEIAGPQRANVACRVYAPVGEHRDLLPYLVRRLLENGANTSFLRRVEDTSLPADAVAADPCERLARFAIKPNPDLPAPPALYPGRRNARGLNLNDPVVLATLARDMEHALARTRQVMPLIAGRHAGGREYAILDPADRRRRVGTAVEADPAAVETALASASRAAAAWDRAGADTRAAALERAADLFERHHAELMALCVREGGKTVPDALAEVREAVDFCRYYALHARRLCGAPQPLPGPTGEHNELSHHGRGVFVCISPWNFPLAIFTGQVSAALAAGNSVIAKPARQTPLVAARAVELLHEAGVPVEALHFLPGAGSALGERLVSDPRCAGVAFTGSTETAWTIQQALARRRGPIVPFIAETGGQNAMIVDSSALPEQVVADVLQSAFDSAGQRCSALRVLFVQEDIAEKILDLLAGGMAELRVGDPARLATDIGPVIDEQARETLAQHAQRMAHAGRLIHQTPLPPETEHGCYFAPRAYEITRMNILEREVFGPVLHVIRYQASALDRVIDAINGTGYGLTLGIHSRIEAFARHIHTRVRAGNTYVNRNMIGAVVGVQPFGGEGLSGTGPKAGGPDYLARFTVERTLTINTAAAGGNAALLAGRDTGAPE